MRVLNFDEFFVEPDGVLFGMVTGSPHAPSGLYLKVRSYEADDDEVDDEGYELDGSRSIIYTDLSDVELPTDNSCSVDEDEIEPDHRFYVYEGGDLGRLAGLIENAMKLRTLTPDRD